MIINGTEEKISGFRLLRSILAEGLVYIPEDGFSYENGRHRIRDIAFSDELRYETGLAENLREITENIVRLFYYVEEDPYFFEDLEHIGSLLRPVIRYEDLTGMTLLYLFTLPLIRLSKIRDSRLKAMVRKCLAYTHDEEVRITVEKSDASLYTTIRIVPGMEATFFAGGPAEEEKRLTVREQNVRKNFALAMERVSDVIRSLEKENPEAGAITERPLPEKTEKAETVGPESTLVSEKAEAEENETVKTVEAEQDAAGSAAGTGEEAAEAFCAERQPETAGLNRLAEEGWKEVRCSHIVLSLPKVFSEIPREKAGEQNGDRAVGQSGEQTSDRVFMSPSGECFVRILDFQPEETLLRRYLLSEETDPEDPACLLYDCFVQTGGGVQHLFFELKKAGREEREDFRKIIEEVLRSIRWLQQ